MDFSLLSGLGAKFKSLFAAPASPMSPEMDQARLAGAMPGESPTSAPSTEDKLSSAGKALQAAGSQSQFYNPTPVAQQQQSSAIRPGGYDLDPRLKFMLQNQNIGVNR